MRGNRVSENLQVSTHSRPKAAGFGQRELMLIDNVSTHSRPKAAGLRARHLVFHEPVSTHSRPKAAGFGRSFGFGWYSCFNTQPPEGGWKQETSCLKASNCFNTQPPEGGWRRRDSSDSKTCCFNTQPPEGGWAPRRDTAAGALVSTHSRPKAAGLAKADYFGAPFGFNTQPPEGGWFRAVFCKDDFAAFQHTAARRRLELLPLTDTTFTGFNTQPPEGGWFRAVFCKDDFAAFQHTAARRRLDA